MPSLSPTDLPTPGPTAGPPTDFEAELSQCEYDLDLILGAMTNCLPATSSPTFAPTDEHALCHICGEGNVVGDPDYMLGYYYTCREIQQHALTTGLPSRACDYYTVSVTDNSFLGRENVHFLLCGTQLLLSETYFILPLSFLTAIC